jgi:hypothetical protein
MAVTDPVADMLTKIENASAAKFEKVDIPTSRLKTGSCKDTEERRLHLKISRRRRSMAITIFVYS